MDCGSAVNRKETQMADKHVIVAMYATYDQADEAFARLRARGSDMGLLSCVGRGYWEEMIGSRNTGDRFHFRGKLGPFWERMWSGTRSWGVFWLFPDGPVLVAGPLVGTIIATQEQGNGENHANGFQAGLSGIGIPMESLVEYEKALINHTIHHDPGTIVERELIDPAKLN
jgi:hypothetical protein